MRETQDPQAMLKALGSALGWVMLFWLLCAVVGPTIDREPVRYEFGPAMARQTGGKP